MKEVAAVSWRKLAGVFLVCLATLMDEILLTRIFSVTMWYHFAFGAISLAMFGMTVGALQVYQHPDTYSPRSATQHMARSCLRFAVTAVGSVLIHMLVPFASKPVFAMLWILFSYCLLSVPFYFSGICVCLALTKFPGKESSLYAADLIGAASGCILVIYALKFSDGPTAVMVLALLASLAAGAFATDSGMPSLSRMAMIASVVFGGLITLNSILVLKQSSPLRVTWAKGRVESRPLYEKWNSFSRITVEGDPNVAYGVITEGISTGYPKDQKARQLQLTIDGGAATTITRFDGTFDNLEYLKYDVKNIVHQLHSNGSVLIIGAGGGRDVLSALSMGQKKILALEINQSILRTLNTRFGDFSGHLDKDPRVTFVNDEARSYIARTNERFDVIEASFIDTWASTAAGALSLTENSLYTVEAWNLFLERLTPNGVLSFSRWYSPRVPGEAYRLTSLAAAALRSAGVSAPRGNILMIRNMRRDIDGFELIGAATILISKRPFSDMEIDHFESIAQQMHFDIVLSPRFARDNTFGVLANGEDPAKLLTSLRLNVSAPSDDSPFFFDMKPVRYLFQRAGQEESGSLTVQPAEFVVVLFFGVAFFTAYFILMPLAKSVNREKVRGSAPYWLYFIAIGLGFMLIEVSQMQRLIVFLGHPTYALSVVLFTLLLSGGIGSFTTSKFISPNRSAAARLLLLCISLLVFGIMTPYAITEFASSTTPVRIILAIAILFPPGMFMGMSFPLGLKMSAETFGGLTPVFWGVNGAASICASILAMAIAMNWGISAAFWTGFWCYCIAFLAYCWAAFSSPAIGAPKRAI